MTAVPLDFPFLRKLLGDNWIDAEVFSKNPTHLLGRWQKEKPEDPLVVRHAEALVEAIFTSKSIRFDPEVLARKLKSATDFVSTLAEMETGLFLAKQGFVVTMEPMAPEKGPDLRADWEEVPYYVEIRTVGSSKEEDRRNSVAEEIFAKMNAVPSSYKVAFTVGDAYKPGSSELREAIRAVTKCLDILKGRGSKQATLWYASKDMAVLELPDVGIPARYRPIVEKSHFTARFEYCGAERAGTPASFLEERKSPPEPVKDHERLKGILEKKRSQLPEASRGIIVLEVSSLFMLSDFSVERALYGDWIVEFPRVSSRGGQLERLRTGETIEVSFFIHLAFRQLLFKGEALRKEKSRTFGGSTRRIAPTPIRSD